jgi:DNA-binding transcriptional ArsR family regulator
MIQRMKDLACNQAAFCKVFGNARRVQILWMLLDHELSVGEIAAAVDASLQNTSQHLHLMKDQGILSSRREGQTIYYSVADNDQIRNCPLVFQGRELNRWPETQPEASSMTIDLKGDKP